MKNNYFTRFFSLLLLLTTAITPTLAQASSLDSLRGVLRNLSEEVGELVTAATRPRPAAPAPKAPEWQTFSSTSTDFTFSYPPDWKISTIFSVSPEYADSVVVVRTNKEDFLRRLLRPGRASNLLVMQDAAIIFQPFASSSLAARLSQPESAVSTSSVTIASSSVVYILESVETNHDRFGGGSTESYLLVNADNASSTMVVEVNYSEALPDHELQTLTRKMIETFHWLPGAATSTFPAASALVTDPGATTIATTTENE